MNIVTKALIHLCEEVKEKGTFEGISGEGFDTYNWKTPNYDYLLKEGVEDGDIYRCIAVIKKFGEDSYTPLFHLEFTEDDRFSYASSEQLIQWGINKGIIDEKTIGVVNADS